MAEPAEKPGAKPTNVMSVDLEVAFAGDVWRMDRDTAHDPRLEPMTDLLLETCREADVRATFFVMGFVAGKYPNLVRRIQAEGHEIGCHSDLHEKPLEISRSHQAEDLARAVRTIEDVIGQKVVSYRAPNFSLTRRNLYTFDLLHAEGLRYDSSIFPMRRFDGGIIGFPTTPCRVELEAGAMYEFPLSVASLLGTSVQLFGGGYFRIAPLWLVTRKFRQLNERASPVVFYIHPHDLDGTQPPYPFRRPPLLWFRHRVRRSSAARRFRTVCRSFRFRSLREVMDGFTPGEARALAPAVTYEGGRYKVYPLM